MQFIHCINHVSTPLPPSSAGFSMDKFVSNNTYSPDLVLLTILKAWRDDLMLWDFVRLDITRSANLASTAS